MRVGVHVDCGGLVYVGDSLSVTCERCGLLTGRVFVDVRVPRPSRPTKIDARCEVDDLGHVRRHEDDCECESTLRMSIS